MNVGILSMQRVVNYGSFLQAFALRKSLEARGAAVHFLDIVPGQMLPGLEWSPATLSSGKVASAVRALAAGRFYERLRNFQFGRQLRNQFETKFYDLLGIRPNAPTSFDLVVIGSDEVFNACQRVSWGFTTQLFGEGLPARRVVSYAASFGHTSLADLDAYGIRQRVAGALASLSQISVRDGNSQEIIKNLTGRTPELHLDPVLTLDWTPFVPRPVERSQDYVVIYTYPGRITREERKAIQAFAASAGKKLVSIGSFYDWCDVIVPETPFEVLAYFAGASHVVTDTFHGSIFSIINRKPFCTMVRPSNRYKLEYLLTQLKLSHRILGNPVSLAPILAAPADFTETERVITEMKQRAASYWDSCFSDLSG